MAPESEHTTLETLMDKKVPKIQKNAQKYGLKDPRIKPKKTEMSVDYIYTLLL